MPEMNEYQKYLNDIPANRKLFVDCKVVGGMLDGEFKPIMTLEAVLRPLDGHEGDLESKVLYFTLEDAKRFSNAVQETIKALQAQNN